MMRRKLLVLFALGICYRMVMSLQGVDDTDAGFCNTFYTVFFDHPDANVFNFIYYLLGFVGALWEQCCGQAGLLGFRLLEACTLAASIGMLCAAFRDLLPRPVLLSAAALSFLFPTIVVTFHYNTFSFLLIASSAYFLMRYLKTEQRLFLVLTGIMVGLAFFVRIVNLTLLSLLVIPLWYDWKRQSWRRGMASSSLMLAGIGCGVGLVALLMLALGNGQYYVAALGEAFSTFSGDEATHSHGQLLIRYFRGYVNILLQVVAVLALWFVYRKSLQSSRVLRVTAVIGFLILAFTSQPYLTALAVCLVLIGTYLVRLPAVSEGLVLSLYLLLATIVYPFGSDIGVAGIFHWCAGLLFFPAVWCATRLWTPALRQGLVAAGLCIGCCAVVRMAGYAYGEDKPRLYNWTPVQSERLNILTDSVKAAHYSNAISAINQHVGESRLLFIANQAAELYYATRCLPFNGHVQPVIYQGERLWQRLDERSRHFGEYPMVAFLNQEWMPEEIPGVQRITEEWMALHHYQLVFDDGYIRLYKTTDIPAATQEKR